MLNHNENVVNVFKENYIANTIDTFNTMFIIGNQLTSQFDEFMQWNPPSPVHGSLNVTSIGILFPFVWLCLQVMAAVGGIVSV